MQECHGRRASSARVMLHLHLPSHGGSAHMPARCCGVPGYQSPTIPPCQTLTPHHHHHHHHHHHRYGESAELTGPAPLPPSQPTSAMSRLNTVMWRTRRLGLPDAEVSRLRGRAPPKELEAALPVRRRGAAVVQGLLAGE